MNIYVVSTFDPSKGLNFERFKGIYANNAAPTLADCVSEWGIAKITEKQNRDHKNGIG
jgi:hypothetical protein